MQWLVFDWTVVWKFSQSKSSFHSHFGEHHYWFIQTLAVESEGSQFAILYKVLFKKKLLENVESENIKKALVITT